MLNNAFVSLETSNIVDSKKILYQFQHKFKIIGHHIECHLLIACLRYGFLKDVQVTIVLVKYILLKLRIKETKPSSPNFSSLIVLMLFTVNKRLSLKFV